MTARKAAKALILLDKKRVSLPNRGFSGDRGGAAPHGPQQSPRSAHARAREKSLGNFQRVKLFGGGLWLPVQLIHPFFADFAVRLSTVG
jgi:hypothetical protein